MNNSKKILVIAGPTAVGKTSVSIELAKSLDAEIVSCDSMQIYKYMDIGTAKVTKEEMCGIKHYMIDELLPTEDCDIKKFVDMARSHIDDILNRNKNVILVGGTGFYLRAILYDNDFLFEDEKLASEIRKKYEDEYAKNGIEPLISKLREIDFESYQKIHKNNVKRVIRALEFYELHNSKISEHNANEKSKNEFYDFVLYILNMDREKLYNRIDERVDIMLQNGLQDELKMLINMGVLQTMTSMQGIGYKELYPYVASDKNIDEEVVALVKQHSRNYAKRQLTWFRKMVDEGDGKFLNSDDQSAKKILSEFKI